MHRGVRGVRQPATVKEVEVEVRVEVEVQAGSLRHLAVCACGAPGGGGGGGAVDPGLWDIVRHIVRAVDDEPKVQVHAEVEVRAGEGRSRAHSGSSSGRSCQDQATKAVAGSLGRGGLYRQRCAAVWHEVLERIQEIKGDVPEKIGVNVEAVPMCCDVLLSGTRPAMIATRTMRSFDGRPLLSGI